MNIACDPAQLELVLLNLAVNASDSMPEGGVLTLETRLAAHNGAAQVTLTVVDTGAGMDSETLRRCLELFFTTKPVGEGVGLASGWRSVSWSRRAASFRARPNP